MTFDVCSALRISRWARRPRMWNARMIATIRQTVEGKGPFCDVKLLTFPEFAHAAPAYPNARTCSGI